MLPYLPQVPESIRMDSVSVVQDAVFPGQRRLHYASFARLRSKPRKMEVILPEIKLDMTLWELYGSVGKEVFFVPTMLSSRFDLTPFIPRCTKYIYQHEAMNQPAHAGLEAVGGLAYVIKFLSMIPQQFAFAAGQLSVVMFDICTLSPESEQIMRMNRLFAQETISVLQPDQRPQLRFYERLADVQLNQTNQILAPCWPVDGLEHLPHTLKPEVQ